MKEPNIKCVTCVYRILSLKDKTCNNCIFYPDFPNYKEDVTITTTKLEFFTAERYSQYAKNSDVSLNTWART